MADDMEINESSKEVSENDSNIIADNLIEHLLSCENVYYKSQQRDEAEISAEEKKDIIMKIYANSKSHFLQRFGKDLTEEHLEYFKQYVTDENDGYAISYYLTDLKRYFTKSKREKDIRNRRYDALRKLVEEESYFTETEMMKRNPLLYEQLIGQYLSEDEKKKRDNIDTKNITFVNLLLESIDRDNIKKIKQQQKDDEDDVMEEQDSSDSEHETLDKTRDTKNDSDSWDEEIPITTKWGEMSSSEEKNKVYPINAERFESFFRTDTKPENIVMITAPERRLLREEFISIMYQNFLDGKDNDFDYSTVDDNEEYDNLDIKSHDAEDTYFDSETPEDVPIEDEKMTAENETEEDELDVYMKRINQHVAVQQISDDIKYNL